MPSTVTVTRGQCIERSAVVLLARILKADGSLAVHADVTAALLKVFDAKAGTLVTPTGGGGGYAGTALTVASVFNDAPTSDPRWDFTDPPSFFPVGGVTYQAEVKFTPASGDPFYVLWQLATTKIYSE
jgi:hypothetical protein